MNLKNIPVGKDIPNDFNVVIEIPAQAQPVKYELDKDSGALFVDRFLATPMHYPCNYGFVPNTLSDDGDPTDVLVLTPLPLLAGSVIRCRAIGVLEMEDEAGLDNKVLALPIEKLCPDYADIQDVEQLPQTHLDRIGHFFEHYKDLEPNKWVKVKEWHGAEKARADIQAGVDGFKG